MKKFRQFTEELISEGGGDSMPADDMTISELKIACFAAQNILDKLENGAMIQRWQISAIVKAKEELASVYTSLSADEVDDDSDEMDWDDEQDDEEPFYVGFEYPSMYGEAAEVRKAGPAKLVSYGPKGNSITASKIATHLHKRASDYTGGNAKLIHDLASEVEKHGDTSANDLIGKHKMIAKKVGMDAKAAHNLISGVASSLKEEVELDEETKYVVKGKSPFYKQDHYINTHETPKAQLIKKNIKHATRMNLETAKKVAKDWESHPNKYKTEVIPVNEATDLDERKEYHVVHKAASLTSAQMKAPVSGDQPTFHKSEQEALDHLNKKYKKVRDGVWKNTKGEFFFHKKKVMGESVELDEISDKLKANYLDKAVQQRYDRFVAPRNTTAPKPKGAAKKAADAAREKANAKDTRRADIIDKTAEKLTGKPHYNKMSTMTTPAVHGNTNDWWKGKKYSKDSE